MWKFLIIFWNLVRDANRFYDSILFLSRFRRPLIINYFLICYWSYTIFFTHNTLSIWNIILSISNFFNSFRWQASGIWSKKFMSMGCLFFAHSLLVINLYDTNKKLVENLFAIYLILIWHWFDISLIHIWCIYFKYHIYFKLVCYWSFISLILVWF